MSLMKTSLELIEKCDVQVTSVMCEQLLIDFDDLARFLTPPKSLKAKPKRCGVKMPKQTWIERVSYVLSETTIVLNEYPDHTNPLITNKDMLRLLMGDLWVMYYGSGGASLWEGLERYQDSEILKVRQEELMATVKRRYLEIIKFGQQNSKDSLTKSGLMISPTTLRSSNNFKH